MGGGGGFFHVLHWEEQNVFGNGIGIVLFPSAHHLSWLTKSVSDQYSFAILRENFKNNLFRGIEMVYWPVMFFNAIKL